MTDDADYTLSGLYDRGIEALASEEPEPGTTYEVAPGLIGRLDPPTLKVRERVHEAGSGLDEILRDDIGEMEDLFDEIGEADSGEETDAPGRQMYREDVSIKEITMTQNRVTCKQAVAALTFDEEVEYGDLVVEMASVVKAHFLSLSAATPSAQKTS
jgi:hypothetical protein